MNIFKKIIEKIKNIFIKKEEVVMLEEGKEYSNDEKNKFKESLKVNVEKVSKKRRKVETNICYGDGLGIKRKMEY